MLRKQASSRRQIDGSVAPEQTIDDTHDSELAHWMPGHTQTSPNVDGFKTPDYGKYPSRFSPPAQINEILYKQDPRIYRQPRKALPLHEDMHQMAPADADQRSASRIPPLRGINIPRPAPAPVPATGTRTAFAWPPIFVPPSPKPRPKLPDNIA